jgi:hypothetical protein
MQSCAEMRHVRWVSFLYDDRNAAARTIFLDGDLSRRLDRVQGTIAVLINWYAAGLIAACHF